MDVVFPLADSSKYKDDFELKYSLRSLDNQPWVDNVYLIGHKPYWIHNVIHVPCCDPYQGCKDANIINKILRACCEPVSRFFVVNSDDQIFLREVEETEMIPCHENPGKDIEYKLKAGVNNWHKRVLETVKYSQANGLNSHIFQSHVPYIIDKFTYPKIMAQLPWGKGNGFTTHIYFNMTMSQVNAEKQKRTARVRHPISEKMVYKAIEGATFLNFNNSGLGKGLMDFLMKRFTNPSRWEQ